MEFFSLQLWFNCWFVVSECWHCLGLVQWVNPADDGIIFHGQQCLMCSRWAPFLNIFNRARFYINQMEKNHPWHNLNSITARNRINIFDFAFVYYFIVWNTFALWFHWILTVTPCKYYEYGLFHRGEKWSQDGVKQYAWSYTTSKRQC